jgi:hypothetical protein
MAKNQLQQELHILIGCADARDLSQAQIDAVAHQRAVFEEKNIDIDLQILRVAGSFVTEDVITDIKRNIEKNQREKYGKYAETRYYVHIQTHGHLTEDSNRDYISEVYQINIVQGSNLNCGMLGATGVGIEIEQMLIEEKLEYDTTCGHFKVENLQGILRLLKDIYAFDGYLAGDWIRSIDYLRTHPRAQRAKLLKAIQQDRDLNRLGIQVTAGIQDYSIHGLIRVDGGEPKVEFWDSLQADIRRRNVRPDASVIQQAQQQQPFAGLISTSDPLATSRILAANYYLGLKGIVCDQYLPNSIFNIAGGSFDLPESPFGPYTIAGFFYAVKHLKLTDQMIMGYDEAQMNRMVQKIYNDPIMSLIVSKFKVNLMPINQINLMKG